MIGMQKAVRVLSVALGVALVGFVSYLLFYRLPATASQLAGIVLAVLSTVLGGVLVTKLVSSAIPAYNVGKISIEGKIVQEESSGLSPVGGDSVSAGTVVEHIEAADENADGLIVEINSGGGGIVPSEQIERAIDDFDGPTIAYATEVCASGGYWVASACDQIWAYQGSMIGSIGVKFSQIRIDELADKVGVSYESIVSGDYKEVMTKFKELEPHERKHLQGITDAFFELFVDRLDDNLELDRATIEESEAQVFIGRDAIEYGIVDELGTQDEVVAEMEQRLGKDAVVRELGDAGVIGQLTGGARSVAYSFGAGVGTGIAKIGESRFEL